MLRNKGMYVLALASVIGLGFAVRAMAQDSRPGSDRPDWRNMTPEQRQQQMDKRLQEDMGATDDEWKVLEPKVKKVQDLSMSARGGGFRGGFGPGPGAFGPGRDNRGGHRGGGQPGQAQPNAEKSTPVQAAREGLQKVLDNKDAKAEEIKKALTAYQEAKAKAKDELAKAQKDLREILSQRQEAVLVLRGVLD